MKKVYILSVFIFSLCLCGCIGFMPKNHRWAGDNEVVADDPQDDAVMEKNTHLKFKGVPIDGTKELFVTRMRRKGFKHIDRRDGMDILQGDFAGYNECYIYVATLENQDLVSRISVRFPDRDQWKYLYGDYKGLKQMLTEKYGKPYECTEKFSRYSLEDDNSRMLDVKLGNCKYISCFKADNGNISLWIENDDMSSCYVVLSYTDKVNGDVIIQQAKNDL